MLPNFFCIGAYRSGTTWLHTVLRTHPEIYLPSEKELYFFSHYYDRGYEWYEQFFQSWNGEKCVGEICPTYLCHEQAASRITADFPAAKILVILRDPVSQVSSFHRMRHRAGVTKGNLRTALKEDDYLLQNALYFAGLSRYRSYLEHGRGLVLFYEDLLQDPRKFLSSITYFLGVSDCLLENIADRVNATRSPRSMTVERIIGGAGDFLWRRGLWRVKSLLKRLGLVNTLRTLNTRAPDPGEVPDDVATIIREHTSEDRRRLAELLERDLSFWT